MSEGIDFADGNARAVMIFGIPYPSVKDTKVGLKRAYNDEGVRTQGLLSGGQWYSQQAFRLAAYHAFKGNLADTTSPLLDQAAISEVQALCTCYPCTLGLLTLESCGTGSRRAFPLFM